MTEKHKHQVPPLTETKIEVRNPRYKDATPEQVARALLRPVPDEKAEDEESSPTVAETNVRSSI